MKDTPHDCRYRAALVWSSWTSRAGVRERTGRRVPICEVCGRERPARHPRVAVAMEEEVDHAGPPLLEGPALQAARVVERRCPGSGQGVPVRGVFSELGAMGIPGSAAVPAVERLMRAGLLRLRWDGPGRRELSEVIVRDPEALAEAARPGARAARAAALTEGRAILEGVEHPVANEARRVLEEETATISPELARAVALVARHAAEGEPVAERVFSTRHLGGSKALARLRASLEQRLGPLASLGIREGASLTLVGGVGKIALAGDAQLDLAATPPFLGLSRETACSIAAVSLPPAGLVAVENLAVFDACCRGEVAALAGAAFVWTAGYPGRGVRAIVEAAVRAGARVTVWCDLDLDGVRIARLVAAVAPGVTFFRMAPADLLAATRRLALGERAARALERELRNGVVDALTPTLAAMREAGMWAEQECFLVREGSGVGPSGCEGSDERARGGSW